MKHFLTLCLATIAIATAAAAPKSKIRPASPDLQPLSYANIVAHVSRKG